MVPSHPLKREALKDPVTVKNALFHIETIQYEKVQGFTGLKIFPRPAGKPAPYPFGRIEEDFIVFGCLVHPYPR